MYLYSCSCSLHKNRHSVAVFPHCVCRVDVMQQLIQSSDLFVMQVEMDVYTALKKVEGKESLHVRLISVV